MRPSARIVASQTCVVLPPCTSDASAVTLPSSAVPRKFVFSSIVVNPVARGSDEILFDVDLTYKVQTEPGGIAQVVGMARDFAGDDRLVVCLGDNIFEYAQADAIAGWDSGALVFVKDVPDPENFGVVAYDGDGSVADIVEKAGVVDMRYPEPPSSDAVVGLYCFPPAVFDVVDTLSPSSRGELEITDVNRVFATRGELRVECVQGWWHDGGKHWADLADVGRLIEETGVNK